MSGLAVGLFLLSLLGGGQVGGQSADGVEHALVEDVPLEGQGERRGGVPDDTWDGQHVGAGDQQGGGGGMAQVVDAQGGQPGQAACFVPAGTGHQVASRPVPASG